MENTILLSLLESVLGKSKHTSKSNYAFVCPFHTSNPPGKRNFEIYIDTDNSGNNKFSCWACGAKGRKLHRLFQRIKAPATKIHELNILISPGKHENIIGDEYITLPEEFISLQDITSLNKLDHLEARRALQYLKKRNITHDDIIKYNIGFCSKGIYSERIIIPSYDALGSINYFMARSYKDSTSSKYKNPPLSNKVIGFELYINWDAPIILCEGAFDALTIKRNVIPLFGKRINDVLMAKLIGSTVDRIYIALDKDAQKDALKCAEKLMEYGKETFMIELEGKDASEMGYAGFLDTLEQTQPLTFSSIMFKKLSNI